MASVVGILAVTFGITVCIVCGITGFLPIERKVQLTTAEEYIAGDNYEGAMDIYSRVGEQDKYLQTWYDYGVWNLEQGNYYDAKTLFSDLAEQYQYGDSAEQSKRSLYLWGQEEESAGEYRAAASRYEEAGDYEDAETLALYSQARQIAADNLMEAEELLLQIPRELLDVDTMLTAIETYADWGGTYALKESSGQNPRHYTDAKLTLVYEQQWNEETPMLEWEVALYVAGKATEYGSEGVMAEWGTLKFTDGSESNRNEFTVTQKTIKLVNTQIDSKYGWNSERKYVFERNEE